MQTQTFTHYPNAMYGHGTPVGTRGSVLVAGRRVAAIQQPWHLNRTWVQRGTDPLEWFECSRLTAHTFTREQV